MNKSQYNKPLILKEKDIDSSKPNVKKGIKCKISTPKYMQINLKRNNFMSMNESLTGGEKKSAKGKRDYRDKSSNAGKKGKYFIEFSRINTTKNRGVSADELLEGPGSSGMAKTTKASKSKLVKVPGEVLIF